MKFLCLVHFRPDAFDGISAEASRALTDATIEHDRKLRAGGHLLFASPLAEPDKGRSIDRRAPVRMGEIDGPFTESKEVVGGFLLLAAKDIDEAQRLFDDDPLAPFCRVEIRPVREEDRHSESGEARPEFTTL